MEIKDVIVKDIRNTLIWCIKESNNHYLIDKCRDLLKHLPKEGNI